MKKTLTTSALAAGLIGFSTLSSAAFYDFQQWVVDNGEQGFDNASPFELTDAGLTLTATAFEQPGMVDSHVYMDDSFNGIIGGMGVCSALTISKQCVNSGDDNVSIDGGSAEVLSWDFSNSVSSLKLELGDSEHFDFNNKSIEYSLDNGMNWLIATTDGSSMLTVSVLGGTEIDFRTIGTGSTNQFYIRNADASVVPVPAAIWLFGSGILGLVGFARRRK